MRHCHLLNEVVMEGVRDMPFAKDLLDITRTDTHGGSKRGPSPSGEVDTCVANFPRRNAVREERSKGWRTRAVDHATESRLNASTYPADSVSHDTIDVLVAILLMFVGAGTRPQWRKRDISNAFRRCPVAAEHLASSWVVLAAEVRRWAAQHLEMPLRATSAVYA